MRCMGSVRVTYVIPSVTIKHMVILGEEATLESVQDVSVEGASVS